jgi:protein tyrosine/serine phosphatase
MKWWKSILLAILLLLPPGAAAVSERLTRYPHRFAEAEPGRIYRGGFPTEENLRRLHKDLGIRTVISLTGDESGTKYLDEKRTATTLGMDFLRFPMPGDGRASYGDLDRAVDALQLAVTAPDKRPVYFHCEAGKQRSNALLASYRLRACGWTMDQVLDELEEKYDLQHDDEAPLVAHLREYAKWLESSGHRPRSPSD